MHLFFFALCFAAQAAVAADMTVCPLWPTPKHFSAGGGVLELAGAEAAAIVLGLGASEPEKYAAERLAGNICKRFGLKYPVLAEGDTPAAAAQLVLLGTRNSNAMLDRLCREKNIALSEKEPGFDGFIIEFVKDNGKDVVLIGGSNERGVIYGQETFFELLRGVGDAVTCPVFSLRDWPAIPWRGRPSATPIAAMLTQGRLDAYVQARLNFVDIRGNVAYGITAGSELDEPLIKQVLAEAHRRGLLVYGVVDCAWNPEKGDELKHNAAALRTFEQLLDMGCDAPWISFDDGTEGPTWRELVQGVMAMAKSRGVRPELVATTPPVHSYGTIETPYNREAAKLGDFADATWFFTRPPCQADANMARKIGMRRMPGWWHNYPRFDCGGFTYSAYSAGTLRPDKKIAYIELTPFSAGWHQPEYDALRDAAQFSCAAMVWGDASAAEEYYAGVLGIWAWAPETHDWRETRRAIYSRIFSPALAEHAMRFDDLLGELKTMFYFSAFKAHPGTAPAIAAQNIPRLKSPEFRQAALELVEELDRALKTLETSAPAESILLKHRLQEYYFEPMRATLDAAQRMAELDYPEHYFTGVSSRLIELLENERLEEAERFLAEAGLIVLERAERATATLKELYDLKFDEYIERWRRHVSDIYGFFIGLLPKRIVKWRVKHDADSGELPDWAFENFGEKVWELAQIETNSAAAQAWIPFGMKDDLMLDLSKAGLNIACAELPARSAGTCRLYIRGWTRDREKTVFMVNGEQAVYGKGWVEIKVKAGANLLVIGQENAATDWGRMFIGVSDPLELLTHRRDGGNTESAPVNDWLLR